MAMTAEQMVQAVYRRVFDKSLGQDEGSLGEAQVLDELNMAAQAINMTIWMQGKCFDPRTVQVSVSATQHEYDLDAAASDYMGMLLTERVTSTEHTAACAGDGSGNGLAAVDGGSDFVLLNADVAETLDDDVFVGWLIEVKSGTGAGDWRTVVDYDHTGHHVGERYARVDRPWSTPLDSTSKCTIWDVGEGQTCGFPDSADFRRKNSNRGLPGVGLAPQLYLRGSYLGFIDQSHGAMTLQVHYAPRPAWRTVGDKHLTWHPLIPTEYHELVVQKAVVECFALENQTPAAIHARDKLVALEKMLLLTVGGRFRQFPASRKIRA